MTFSMTSNMPPPIPLGSTTLDPNSHTLVMGIINTTPDSFSDGGVHAAADVAAASALRMFEDGADIVDVGGESTRPGSLPVSVSEESARVISVVRAIHKDRPNAVISIDTRRRAVAEEAVKAGASIINDVSGFRDDPSMVELARDAGCAVILMHMLGEPRTMHHTIHYQSFPEDISLFFQERIRFLEDAGIAPEKIIIDPGIGFGKTFRQNLILINRLDLFKQFGKHILLAASRKGFLGKILNEPVPAHRDTGTLAVVTAAILRGASIVRVHEVSRTVQACRVADAVIRERIM